MRLFARAVVETAGYVVHGALAVLLAVRVACAVHDATNEPPPDTTTTGTDRPPPEYDPTPDAVPDIRPLLADPMSPNGEPVHLHVDFSGGE